MSDFKKSRQTSFYVVDSDYKIVYFNDALQALYPNLACGQVCHKVLCNEEEPCGNCPLRDESAAEQLFFNKILGRWICVTTARTEWPGAGACHILLASQADFDSKNLFLKFMNQEVYSEMLELNPKTGVYRTIYATDGKMDLEKRQDSIDNMVDKFIQNWAHPEEKKAIRDFWDRDRIMEVVQSGNFSALRGEFRKKTEDGWHWFQVQLLPVRVNHPEEGNLMCFIGDIQEQKRWEDCLLDGSGVDPLTGLLRQGAYFKKVEKLLEENPETEYCMLALDIEHFKMYNEWYGMDEGDEFLADIAQQLREAEVNYGGVAGYFGHDDFCIVMPYIQSLLKRLEDNVSDYIRNNGKSAGFLPKFGIYVIEDAKMKVSAMYDRAVIAMAKIKGNYSVRVCKFNQNMYEQMENEHALQQDVQRALKAGEFIFYLQPQCNMRTGRIVGAEALVRWKHKDKGMVSPGVFIPVLEKNGFIVDLDRYIWEAVCRWQRELIDRGIKTVPVSVNVSRMDIYFMDVGTVFCKLIEKYQLSPEMIKIEITESAYMEGFDSIMSTVKILQQAGFKVLMDDFGSGYSSLNMLKDVTVDVLKMDMKFLDIGQASLERGIGILESVIDMARLMGIPVISEGVETQEQKETLMDMGCVYAQGYYFYRPLPVGEFEEFLMDEDIMDYRGIRIRQVEQVHIREFLDANLFSDTMVNNILGAVAFYEVYQDKVNIVRVNEQYYRVTGLETGSNNDYYRKNILNFVYEEDRRVLFDIFERAAENRLNGAQGDVRYLKNDGSMVWLHLRFFFLNERDEKKMYYGSISDVTESYTREELLQSSQKALSTVMDVSAGDELFMQLPEENRRAASAIMAQTNQGGLIGAYCEKEMPMYFANTAMLKLLGYDSFEELKTQIKDSFENAIYEDDRERTMKEFAGIRTVGKEYTTTYRMLRKDGTWFWTVDHGKVVETEDGRLAIVSAVTDITETMREQNKLSERNEFLLRQNQELQFLNKDMPGGYHRCSKEAGFPFLYISDRFLEIFGYTREEIKERFGNKFINMVHPEDRGLAIERSQKRVMDSDSCQTEYRMLSKNGYIWVVDENRLLEYDKQEFFQGIVIDVTETIELRNQMKIFRAHTPLDIFVMTIGPKHTKYSVLANGLTKKWGISLSDIESDLNSREFFNRMELDEAKRMSLSFEQAMRDRESFSEVFQIVDHQGRLLHLKFSAHYMEQIGEDVKFLCILSDVTAEKQKDNEAMLLSSKMKATLEMENINSWEWDIAGHTLTLLELASDGIADKFGADIPRDGSVIRDFPECFLQSVLILPTYNDRFENYVKAMYANTAKDPISLNIPFRSDTGQIIWVRVKGRTIYDNTGKPIRVAGSYKNVTQTIRQEREREQKQNAETNVADTNKA